MMTCCDPDCVLTLWRVKVYFTVGEVTYWCRYCVKLDLACRC